MENSMKITELSDEQLATVTGGYGSASNFAIVEQANIVLTGTLTANDNGINQVAPTNIATTLQIAKTYFYA
jgi:bacteriocin-like protein